MNTSTNNSILSMRWQTVFSETGIQPFFFIVSEPAIQQIVWVKIAKSQTLIIPREVPANYTGTYDVTIRGEVTALFEHPSKPIERVNFHMYGTSARNLAYAYENFERLLNEDTEKSRLRPKTAFSKVPSAYRIMKVKLHEQCRAPLASVIAEFIPVGYMLESDIVTDPEHPHFIPQQSAKVPSVSTVVDTLLKCTILPGDRKHICLSTWRKCRVLLDLVANGLATPEQAFNDPENYELLVREHKTYDATA